MKTTIVTAMNPFKAEPSGIQAYVVGFIETIKNMEIDITLIHTGSGDHEKRIPNVKYVPIKIKRISSISFLTKLMVKTPFLKLPRDSIIHGNRPDFMLPFVLFKRKNPKVCTLHGIPNIGIRTRKSPFIWGIYNLMERLTLTRIDKLIAVNQSAKDYYSRKYPLLSEKIVIIPVGIDTKIFKPKDGMGLREKYGFNQDDVIILYIGRFSIEKGIDLLLEAYRELRSEIPKSRLILLGRGPEENKLRDIIKTHHIEGVTFMEPVGHKEIPEIINCADVLTLCSMYEGMPTVVLEALACGVPVVSTDVGDVKKVVIDGKTGQLIRRRYPEAVKNAISEVLRNGRDDYIEGCIAVAKRYSWENISQKIVGVYKEVVKDL